MKKGFTLSELLITLGIIGVISALTLPSVINNASDAKVGPSLAKAVATFEHANVALLSEQDVSAITETEIPDVLVNEEGVNSYWNALSDYMIINNVESEGQPKKTEEGFYFKIQI